MTPISFYVHYPPNPNEYRHNPYIFTN